MNSKTQGMFISWQVLHESTVLPNGLTVASVLLNSKNPTSNFSPFTNQHTSLFIFSSDLSVTSFLRMQTKQYYTVQKIPEAISNMSL